MTRTRIVVLAVVAAAVGAGWFAWRHARLGAPGGQRVSTVQDTTRPRRGPVQPPKDAAEFAARLRDPRWQVRAWAVGGLVRRQDIPTPERARLVLEVLDREVAAPTDAMIPAGSWPPFTNFLRIHYLHVLEQLGPDAAAPIRGALPARGGEAREWSVLALGAVGAADAAPELRQLLARSTDADVRMTAARYLGWLNDREAVPVLRAALADTATATAVSDIVGRAPVRFYPVREQAAGALEQLGMTVQRRGNTFSVQ
ncbi:MAG TPA: HEAT repeat domain-containing protein [Gemmatimonadales bacterium]|nr:HEAT repeat domain-containing protein [Gemmatimonadales bacterium]